MRPLNARSLFFLVALAATLIVTPGQVAARDDPRVILNPAALEDDLAEFQSELEARWAYVETNGVDLEAAVEGVRSRAGDDGISVQELGIELEKIIALFIDGHAGVRNADYPGGYLPLLVSLSGDRLVAYREDRRSLVDPDHPYLIEIDGLPVEEWLRVAQVFHPVGSAQYRRRQGARMLRRLQFLRGEFQRPKAPTAEIGLSNHNGSSTAKLTVPISDDQPQYGTWPMRGSALIPGDIGYLRISAMRDWQVGEIDQWMNHFRDAKGLIVDVRGNGGGSRDALRALFPYLMGEDDRPWVMNVGKFRLHEDREPHHMTRRFMYPADSVHWTAAERESIEEFMVNWQPEWVPPATKFSDWHFMVMSRRINSRAYHFDKPMVILLDYSCFSATDIFVSAFKGWPNVTLVGTPSGGGSALSQTFELSKSHLQIRHASMASFQRSGRLHDGNGTEPDIRVEPVPEFFLKHGRDNQLETALQVLGDSGDTAVVEGGN